MGDNGQFELNIPNRLALITVLPKQGDLMTCRIVQELRMEAGLSQQELDDFITVDEQGRPIIKPDHPVKKIPIGPPARALIMERLAAMDKDKTLTIDHLGIYDMFIVPRKES